MSFSIIKVDSISSTNSLMKYASKFISFDDFTFLIAKNQLQGRGQFNRVWQTEANKNITLSFSYKLDKLVDAHQINMIFCVLVKEFLSKYVSDIRIKKPNDIYIKDKKIAGILIENRVSSNNIQSIIGIGININQTNFSDDLQATSLAKEKNTSFNLNKLSIDFMKFIYQKITSVNNLQKIQDDYFNEVN